jgi:DNA-binding NtrC family response regulator
VDRLAGRGNEFDWWTLEPARKPLLVRHFAQEFSRRMNKRLETIPCETLQALTHYHWPGNIRELQNLIERAAILSPGPVLRVRLSELNLKAAMATADVSPLTQDILEDSEHKHALGTLDEVERKHILSVLKETRWVRAQRLKARVVQHPLQVSRLLTVKIKSSTQFNHRVADFPYTLESALQVFLQVIADRVELQADRYA